MLSYFTLPDEPWHNDQLSYISKIIDNWHNPPGICENEQGWVRRLHGCSLTNMALGKSCMILILRGSKHMQESKKSKQKVLSKGSIVFLPAGETIYCKNTPENDSDYLAFTISFSEDTIMRTKSRLPLEATNEKDTARRLIASIRLFLDFFAGHIDRTLSLMQQE